MSRNLDRLRRGERWWPAEAVLRALGLLVLAASGRLALIAHRLLSASQPHQATAREFGLCLAIGLLLNLGLGLLLFGPKLFEHVPIPPHSAWY